MSTVSSVSIMSRSVQKKKCLWAKSSSFTWYQKEHLVWLQAAAFAHRLPSQPASFKLNRHNCDIKRDGEAKSHFCSHFGSKALVEPWEIINHFSLPRSSNSSWHQSEVQLRKRMINRFDSCVNFPVSDAATAAGTIGGHTSVWKFGAAQQLLKEQICLCSCLLTLSVEHITFKVNIFKPSRNNKQPFLPSKICNTLKYSHLILTILF